MSATLEHFIKIAQCVTCGDALPPLIIGCDAHARRWACRKCGASYLATLDPSCTAAMRKQLKPVHYFPEQAREPSMFGKLEMGRELRRHPRRLITMKVLATRLDDDLFPMGGNFYVLSKDLSEGGMAMLHNSPIDGKMAILLELPRIGYVQILLRVVRCQKVGELYELGGEFLERL